MNQALLNALEAQGARCGHIDGKAACGVYVLDMECAHSEEAAWANTAERRAEWRTTACVEAWKRGYEAGFRVGADGMDLDQETIEHVLPEDV